MLLRCTFLLLTGLFSLNLSAKSAWSQLAEHDINFIYDTVKANHPGYLDNDNPYFRTWLESGYADAIKQSADATSLSDVMTVLQLYVAGFGDGHFSLNLKYQAKRLKWAGIQIKKFGNDYRVAYADSEHAELMPPVMAKLVSCDGMMVDQIMAEHVLKYRFNNPSLNFPKVWHAAKILVDDGIGKRPHFGQCVFENAGKENAINLVWQSISSSRYQTKTASQKKSNTYFLQNNADASYWVSLPKFYPNKEEQKALRDVINELKTVSANARQIVLDVRGNGGGNSQWGVEVARAIYGDAYIENFLANNKDKSYPLWRVSTDNTRHIESILPWIEEQFGKDSTMLKNFSELKNNMDKALDNGTDFVKQPSDNKAVSTQLESGVKPLSNANVLFLTDSSCGSACLDFADIILKLPNVHHIGQETGADTVYMDIRYVELPSGLGGFSLAQKVYRGRTRKHNESYKPEYVYNQNINDTDALKNWIHTITIK